MAQHSEGEIKEAARRAFRDPSYADKILRGEEDYPTVREAILKDISGASSDAEVEGYFFTLQSQGVSAGLYNYIISGPKPGGVNLATISGLASPW